MPRFLARAVPLLVTALLSVPIAAQESTQEQQRRVTGRVTDQNTGEPVPGASVIVSGTGLGATVNEQGQYFLRVPEGAQTLIVRRIGYRRKSVPLGAADSVVNATLERDVLQLETQVVTGTVTSVARQNAANDVGQVTADQLARVPAPSVENAIAGKIAGAQVSANSGAPGGGNQIRLRGVTSVFGSADPLYVVDGVIVSNNTIQPGSNALSGANRNTLDASNQDNGVNRIADLNPNDVESIEVLKGASASAIYGSKASNGVIIITTKGGSAGKTQVDVLQRFGTRDLSNTYGARRFTLEEAREFGIANGFTQEQVDANYASCGGFCNYEEELFGEHPFNYETSISARGGTASTTYFASALNMHDGGIQKNTDYNKQALRLNLRQTIGSRLTVDINNNLIRTLTRRGISNNDNANITPYFVMAGTPSWLDLRPKGGVYPANKFATTNPIQNADFLQNPEEVYRLISSVAANYNVLANDRQTLSFRVDGGIDRFNQQDNLVSPRFLYFEPNDGLPGTVTSLSGNVIDANVNASATHQFFPASRAFSARTSLGVQREIANQRSTNTVTRNVIFGQDNTNRGSAVDVFAHREERRDFALFGQEEVLLLDERLLLTAGARGERSTANGDISHYYWFPKASVSYRLPGLFAFVDELKPRFAYGQSGNLPLYIQKYSPALVGTYGGQNGITPGRVLGSTTIRPERQTELEGGVDATMLNSRASLAFTVYQKTINDVIFQAVTGPSRGSEVQILNGGRIRNRGTEVLLGLTPLQTPSLSWVSRTTFARNVGVVTALPPGVTAFNVERDATGQRVAFGAGYGIARLEVGKRVTQIVGNNGIDADGNVIVTQKGDAAPDFTMGFSNDVTFGKWRLGSLFDWQRGGDLVNITMDVYDAVGNSPDRADGGLSRAKLNDADQVAQYIFDASYVKLRELSLSYELPTALVSRVFFNGAKSARLELSGRNLVTWTDYPGVDPEVSNFGSQQISRFIDLAPFPPSRTFYFTIDASF